MTQYARLPPSGITVIIVGAGFAGLCAAIECDRKGHKAILLEKISELKSLGDIISFSSNSGRIFERWEGVVESLDPIIHRSDGLNFHSWEGEYMTTQRWGSEQQYGRRINGHRAEIHEAVYRHALARGIDVRLGQNVTDYFETDTEAGVVVNGEKMTADCVLAAEGVKSRGRKIVLGFEDRPKASGYAVYRAWFPANEVAKNEKTKFMVEKGDSHNGWIGEDKHFLVASVKKGTEISWVLTHKDEADIDESWSYPGKKEDVIKDLTGWDPVVHDLVNMTPADRLVDYKLVFRDPLPTFISPKARTALIGDAAHPFLPTSIQGASQSMEDGVAMAICLEKCGKDRVPLAIKAYEAIRYDRVHKAQRTGVTTREQWHKADWDAIRKDPTSLHLKRDPWLLDFDQEPFTYSVIDDTIANLEKEKDPQVTINGSPSDEKNALPKVVETELVGVGQ